MSAKPTPQTVFKHAKFSREDLLVSIEVLETSLKFFIAEQERLKNELSEYIKPLPARVIRINTHEKFRIPGQA